MIYPGEDKILSFLKKRGKATFEQLLKFCTLNPDSARRAIESLEDKGLIEKEKRISKSAEPTEEFKSYISKKELPEYSVYKKALKGVKVSELTPEERDVGLQWALKKSLVSIDSGSLKTLKNEEQAEEINEKTISKLEWEGNEELSNELLKRKLLIQKEEVSLSISITSKGAGTKEEMLSSSAFSAEVETKDAEMGKTHPLSNAIMRVKEIFVEMGFEEMEGEYIDSTFWTFDALFQPQDHPARELADTFYVDKSFPLPDPKLVKRVKDSHEKGWKYKWQESEAKKGVLRTHTTDLSAKYLSKLKEPCKKYFAVGRVFRNEATDFKHLSEFHQVEGIVAWKNATFRDLLGILKEFYKKLGFEKIRFMPSYFPYTEPSVEIEVYYEPRKEWMELGGAGMFRPEVTKPLTDIYPVLAWGLSLERPLMLSLGIKDIRTFYKNDVEWLRKTRVKQ